MRCLSRLLGYSYQRPVKHHRSDVRLLHAGRTCVSTRVAPIADTRTAMAVCVAAAVVAKVCVDGVVAQPFCESEKRKLASELRGSDPRTGTLKERRHGGRVLATQIYGCIDGICWFLRCGGCTTSERETSRLLCQSEASEHDSWGRGHEAQLIRVLERTIVRM